MWDKFLKMREQDKFNFFNRQLYPDEFQISISSPNFILEPLILYLTAYLTSPLQCPNFTSLELTSLFGPPPPPHLVHSCSSSHRNGKFSCLHQNPGSHPWLLPRSFTFSKLLFCHLDFLNISRQAFPTPLYYLNSITINFHLDFTFMF